MTNVEQIKTRPLATNYDALADHDLAALMDLIQGKPFDDLKADIAKQGILTPIMLYEGKILDGRNRYRAAKAVGHRFVGANFEAFEGDAAAAEAYVFSVNAQRRQMTNAQKTAVIERLILKYPDDSDRAIARRTGFTSHSQVGVIREKIENPPEKQEYEKVCKSFNTMDDRYRVEFVKKFRSDLMELLQPEVGF
jgi:hypothetical protein